MISNSASLLAAIITLAAAASAVFAGGASVVYDFVQRFPDAVVSDAMSPGIQTGKSNGIIKPSIFLHPTGAGDTIAEYSVALPKLSTGEKLVFIYSAGLSEAIPMNDAAHPFDGVAFELKVNGKKEFEADLKDFGWRDGAVDLTPQAGKEIKVAFITRGNKNTNYDWALWGAPQVFRLSRNILSAGTAPVAKGIVVAEPSRDATLTITPVGGGQPITISLSKGRFAAAKFDFISAGAQSVKVEYAGDARDIGVYGFSPILEITAFGPTSSFLYRGKPTILRAVVRNTGEGALRESDGASVTFGWHDETMPTRGNQAFAEVAVIQVGALQPGESKILETSFTPTGNSEEAKVSALVGVKDEPMTGLQSGISLTSTAPVVDEKLSNESVTLGNAKLHMQFLKSSSGFAAWTMSIPKGDGWEQVATGLFGKLLGGPVQGKEWEFRLYPTEAITSSDSVTLSLKKQIGGSRCTFEWTFRVDGTQPKVVIAQSMKTSLPLDIHHFSGPMVYAGDGTFGYEKDEGLFPGLEYLLTEQSSGTEFVSPPNNLRTVPHPNKITIPFMAIRNGGTLVMLEWDPLQKWDGKADRPSVVFASPNFLEAQDNHLMGLFAPSVPSGMPENKLVAEKPYTLAAGESIRLEATLSVKTDSITVLDAVDEWIARHGLPEPPRIAGKPEDLCDQSFLGSSWDPTLKAWKHTNTHVATFDPMIANYLFARSNRLHEASKIRDVVTAATDTVKGSVPLSTSLYVGGVREALDRQYQQIEGLMTGQREDGSWAYAPDKEHEVFGKPGDTSSGWTALRAQQILEHALVTGDTKAKAAGLKALRFLDTTTRPEGAQTWELQLHVPDILASAYLVRSYLAGYRLTDEKRYLDRAVYWAKSGLPFVYLWNADDQPIMRYGTIPVFGSTWFDKQPWFGVMVQWCGLEYGYSLDKLSDFDKSLPWKQISRGILNCGVQQQEYVTREYPADAGMYPDAYSPIMGKEQYHWDLNPRLIARNLLRDAGADSEPTTHSVRDRRSHLLTLTLPIQDLKPAYVQGSLNADFTYAPSTIYALTGGIYHPETLDLNGEAIPVSEYLSHVGIAKMQPRATNHMVIDLAQHEAHPALK